MDKYFRKKIDSTPLNDDKSRPNHYKIGAITLLISLIGAGGKYLYDMYRLRTKKNNEENNKVRVIV